MALVTDNIDIQETYFRIYTGKDGDYYPEIIEVVDGIKSSRSIRICMSGGIAPSEVKLAVANLWRVMEKHKLNEPVDPTY